MKQLLLILLLFTAGKTICQTKIEGEYYFNKQEMVAGFKFSAGNKFEFFFSYGAVDRSATGTFLVNGDTLKLTSNKKGGNDFTVIAQSRQAKGYTVVFDDANKFLVKDIRCIFFTNGETKEAYSDENGVVHIDLPHCDSIYAQHPLYPDIMTQVKGIANTNDHFRLILNPSLAEVSFKGVDFKINNDKTISCLRNYFMDLENIEFTRQ